MRLESARVELHEANAFVRLVHRHHDPVLNHRFSIGAFTRDRGIVAVGICGRPVARNIDQKHVLEVLRCATNGHRNACSFGYRAVVTYTSIDEAGSSLRACGWWPEVLDPRSDYSFASSTRAREMKRGKDLGQKIRWLWLTGAGL